MEESGITKKIAEISKTAAAFNRLYETIGILRAPGGCPWDRDQTPLSMRRDLVEEAFEAVDAINQNDPDHVKEELGDVILNSSMIAYMYEQKENFSIAEVLNELVDKLIRRHPHVFPESEGRACMDKTVKSSEEVLNQWDKIKTDIEGRSGKTILDEVPAGFPPLLKAYKMQKKAAKLSFDWQNSGAVVEKMKEEFEEVRQALNDIEKMKELSSSTAKPFTVNSSTEKNKAQLHLEEEIGDFLFAAVNYSRHLGVDPSVALNASNEKFYRRFSCVEQKMRAEKIPMDSDHLEQMEQYWNEVKQKEIRGTSKNSLKVSLSH